MYVQKLKGFWKDIGLPTDFLKATKILLNYFKDRREEIDDFILIHDNS